MKNITILLILLFSAVTLHAQTLDELLKSAVENNPELKALQLRYEAALTKSDQVSQLSQPKIGMGIPIESPETRLGPQVLMINASQVFPWFGTLKSKENVALSMAKSDYEKIAAVKLDLFYKVRTAYYNLYLISEKQRILNENIRLFKSLEQVALSKVESGKSTIADVLRVQIKLNELERKIELLQNDKTKFYVQINQVINRVITDSTTIDGNYNSIASIDINLDLIQEKLEQHHPLVSQINAQQEASKQRQMVNRNMGAPSFSVGLDYSMVDNRTDANPEFNGKDIFIPKAMFSIPIYRKQYKAKNKDEELNQKALEFKKEDLINKMLAAILIYKSKFNNAVINTSLSEEQIKKTELAYEVLISEYSGKGEKFDELILLQNQLLKYKLDLINAAVQTHLAKAEIDRITDF